MDGDGGVQLWTQKEVAARLGVSEKTVQRLRLSGALAFVPGKPVRVRSDEVARWVAEREKDGQEWLSNRELEARARGPENCPTQGLSRTTGASGKSAGPNATKLRAVRALAVIRPGRLTGKKPKP